MAPIYGLSCKLAAQRAQAAAYACCLWRISPRVYTGGATSSRSENVIGFPQIVLPKHRWLVLTAVLAATILVPLDLAARLGSSGASPQGRSALDTTPPPIPVDQIIQKFSERESEFKRERDNFTYTQTFDFQTLDMDGQPDGEYRLISDILFTPAGKRYEHVVEAPVSTITRLLFTQEDEDDLRNIQPFVLTADQLPKYDVKYVGKEQIDELTCYVFEVAPKKIEKKDRYFQGRVWVEDRDLNIVKSAGKVAYQEKKGSDQQFPHFETYRENIEGRFWFPTYTRANDVLHFRTADVPIHMVVRYEKYKRFTSTIKIGAATEVPDEKKPAKPPQK